MLSAGIDGRTAIDMRVLRFIADYWYVPLIALAAIIGAVFLNRTRPGWKKSGKSFQTLETELAAIKAKREVRELKLQLGAEQAKQHVLDKYAAQRESLDREAEDRITKLENDPEQLAKVLERLTRERG